MVLLRFLELEFCSVWMNCTVFNVALEHCCYIYWTDSGRSQTFLLFSGITSNLFCSLLIFFLDFSDFLLFIALFGFYLFLSIDIDELKLDLDEQLLREVNWTFMCSLSLFLHNALHLDFPDIALGLFTGW